MRIPEEVLQQGDVEEYIKLHLFTNVPQQGTLKIEHKMYQNAHSRRSTAAG
jgi:hypothetical protein